MVGGKVTKVAYEGSEYVRVERPLIGDIGKVVFPRGSLEVGDFYIITGVTIYSEETYSHYFLEGEIDSNVASRRMIYFRKLTDDSPSTDERIDSLETRVTALEEGAEDSGVDEVTGGISESKYSPRDVVRGDSGNLYVLYCRCPENDYAGEGIAWRANESYFGWIGEDQIEKVSDEITSATPKVGDKVIVVKEIASRGKYAVGDVLTVEEVVGDSGILVKDLGVGLLSSEFKVVEIAPVAPTFKVGEFAKVVGRTFAGDLTTGSIVKITEEADCDGDYRAELLDGSDYDHAPATSLEKLPEKEAKFAKIGRKVDEYKVGDIVEVIDDKYGTGEVGDIFEAESLRAGKFPENRNGRAAYVGPAGDTVKLITPVEHRFDK